MKLTNQKFRFSTLILIFTAVMFISCNNGNSAHNEPPAPTQAVTTSGTITAGSIGSTSSGTITVTTDSNGSHYEFISIVQPESRSANIRSATVDTTKGGFWKFYVGNNLKYTGTYKGDISDFAVILSAIKQDVPVGSVKLELKVTAIANDEGNLFEVPAADAFDFEIKTVTNSENTTSFSFEAEIPAVTATATTVEAPASNTRNINTLTGTYAGTITAIGGGATSQDSVTINGNSYVWKKDCGNGEYIYWRGTVFLAVTENQFVFTNSERAEPAANAEPTVWTSGPNDIFIIYASYNSTEDKLTFTSQKGYASSTNTWTTMDLSSFNFVFTKVQSTGIN